MSLQIQKEKLSIKLREKLKEQLVKKPKDKLVFLCIGTDKVIGDAFGPCVGEELRKRITNCRDVDIWGSLQQPVHYQNIERVLKKIDDRTSFVIAIDAAISEKEDVGKIVLEEKGLILGGGLQKTKGRIGNLSIKGIVSVNYQIPNINYLMLQQVSMRLVLKMAQETAQEIYKGIF